MGRAAETLVGAVATTAARGIGAVQSAVRLQERARPLLPSEAEVLRSVFRRSLDLSRIRLVVGRSGLFGLSDRPFTLGDVIYMKRTDPAARIDVLVHEACHVWQYRHEGTRYAGGALLAQLAKGRGAYDWQAEWRSGLGWTRFNREAQAQFVQDVFRYGGRGGRAGNGAFFDEEPLGDDIFFQAGGADLTAFAREAVERLRRPVTNA